MMKNENYLIWRLELEHCSHSACNPGCFSKYLGIGNISLHSYQPEFFNWLNKNKNYCYYSIKNA